MTAPSIEELAEKLRASGQEDMVSRVEQLDQKVSAQYAHDQELRSDYRWNHGRDANDYFERQAELKSDPTMAHLVSDASPSRERTYTLVEHERTMSR